MIENKLTKDKEEILLSKNEGKLLKYLMENSKSNDYKGEIKWKLFGILMETLLMKIQ